MRIYGKSLIVLGMLTALAMSATATAQPADSFRKDLRFQPFVYGSLGGFPSGAGGGGTFGFGGGVDWLVANGLGLGGDIVLFGNNTFGFGVASVNASYHFIPSRSRIVPFVKAGIGSGGELGEGGVSIGTIGGGVNLWSSRGMAVRIEVLDRFPIEGGDHHIAAQLGITF
jgi:hypothetical protein